MHHTTKCSIHFLFFSAALLILAPLSHAGKIYSGISSKIFAENSSEVSDQAKLHHLVSLVNKSQKEASQLTVFLLLQISAKDRKLLEGEHLADKRCQVIKEAMLSGSSLRGFP